MLSGECKLIQFLKKKKSLEFPVCDPGLLILKLYPREMKSAHGRDACLLPVVLSVETKLQNQELSHKICVGAHKMMKA